jgi:peptidoglycan/LPS O-acetylase OafA/YrhL
MHRIRQLDGVRALAILAVFLHHALRIKLMWAGVDLFFVLSGFLITGVLLNTRQRPLGGFFAHFYSRRARRILVPYLLFLAVASIFLGSGWLHYWYFYILLTNLLRTLGIPVPQALLPLWSLAVEEQFYLVWPLAVYFLNERALKKLCIALIVVVPALRGAFHFADRWPIYELTPFRMDLLASGALLYLIWNSRRTVVERIGTLTGAILVAVGLSGLGLLARFGITTDGNTRTGTVFIYECCLFLSVGIMLYALAGKGVAWLQTRPIAYIGRISYTMYLVHVGIIMLVQNKLHGYAAAAVALGLTIAYAAVSWHLLERRLLSTGGAKPRPQFETA